MDSYIRTDDGVLMVRRSSHQYVSADYAVRHRMIIGGRLLTSQDFEAIKSKVTEKVLEAAE